MNIRARLFSAALLPTTVLAAPVNTTSPCATVARYAQNLANPNNTGPLLPAEIAYSCLQTVPLNQSLAINFTTEYQSVLQFQSTIDYLKSPPSSYQQSSVDLEDGIAKILQAVKDGRYANEWEWESAIQNLISQAHDGHLYLTAGIWGSVFAFVAPLQVVSLSLDGKETPRLYVPIDVVQVQSSPNVTWTPSSLSRINGIDAVQWIEQFAKNNSQGMLEANAEWNTIMFSAVGSVAGQSLGIQSNDLVDGGAFRVEFQNGTTLNATWSAVPKSKDISWDLLANLTSGADYYSTFVVYTQPTKADEGEGPLPTQTATASAAPADATAWPYNAFPQKPALVQPKLGEQADDAGWLTGYTYPEASLGVISIPSFSMSADAVQSYSEFIKEFLNQSKAAGLRKILFDVSSNGGGNALLAMEAFKVTFPQLEPYAASTQRAFEEADLIGSTLTEDYERNRDNATYINDYQSLAQNWIAPIYLDASTGDAFPDWKAYYGPQKDYASFSTNPKQENYSNLAYTSVAIGEPGFAISGYANRTNFNPVAAYAASDIAILTDGVCSSTCTVFVELFHHVAGVKVVTVGGLPRAGPMQAAAGVRGAQAYDDKKLYSDIQSAIAIDNSLASRLPSLLYDFRVDTLSFNLWNQVRRNETIPRQFAYEAADCRIWARPETFNNYTNLWQYAAEAIWRNSSLCVEGSTGQGDNGTFGPGGNGQSSGAPGSITQEGAAGTVSGNVQLMTLCLAMLFAAAMVL